MPRQRRPEAGDGPLTMYQGTPSLAHCHAALVRRPLDRARAADCATDAGSAENGNENDGNGSRRRGRRDASKITCCFPGALVNCNLSTDLITIIPSCKNTGGQMRGSVSIFKCLLPASIIALTSQTKSSRMHMSSRSAMRLTARPCEIPKGYALDSVRLQTTMLLSIQNSITTT